MKSALITGSGNGIGRAAALALADSVDMVGVHYFRNAGPAEETAALIRKKGSSCRILQADLRDPGQAVRMIREAEEYFGRLDILVNNVGPFLSKPWAEISTEEWDSQIEGNLKTAFHCMQAVLPGMRHRKWGRIINLGFSRVEEPAAFSRIVPYAAAKAGLLVLTRAAAASEAPFGITVNMVSPGLIEGSRLPAGFEVPSGRLGRPEDIAWAISFLAADESEYITGINLIVSGGWKL